MSFPFAPSSTRAARPRGGRARRTLALHALAALAACGGGGDPVRPPTELPPGRPVLAATYRPSGRAAAGDTFVHLFEWRWPDIAAECEGVLGPAGYKAVQVSPPQEHLLSAGREWWQRYQPASYTLARSRSGSEAEFRDMVTRCRAAGVDIYVDAVINHMAGTDGVGSNGTRFTKYAYPGLWDRGDFHPSCGVSNYNDAANVQDCELLGLADLNTSLTTVRRKLADYLIAVHRTGVAGFRIDAAKHIQPVDLDAIVNLVNQAAVTEGRALPYWFLEVIDYGNEGVRVGDYLGAGYASGGASDVTEFKYRGLQDKFLGTGGQKLSDFRTFSVANWNILPSDKAVAFVENHDTQRDGGIWYRDGQTLRLSYVWLLGYPYGYPSVMSSYAFNRGSPGRDAGPPSAADGTTNPVRCAVSWESATIGDWVCEHRDPVVRRMVRFRKEMAGADVQRFWDNGNNAIAFSRGARGFVAISRETAAVAATVPSGLPPGTYCDVLAGGRVGTACAGAAVTVGPDGAVALTLPANSAIVLQAGVGL